MFYKYNNLKTKMTVGCIICGNPIELTPQLQAAVNAGKTIVGVCNECKTTIAYAKEKMNLSLADMASSDKKDEEPTPTEDEPKTDSPLVSIRQEPSPEPSNDDKLDEELIDLNEEEASDKDDVELDEELIDVEEDEEPEDEEEECEDWPNDEEESEPEDEEPVEKSEDEEDDEFYNAVDVLVDEEEEPEDEDEEELVDEVDEEESDNDDER